MQRSIKDFFHAPPPPPSAEREAKRQRTIGSYFAAAERSPAGGRGDGVAGCAVPTPAQRKEAGSSTAKSPSCSQWGRPGRTANPRPSCARRISLGEGVRALAAHRREVSIREASNEAPSADEPAASVSNEHSELAPAGPVEHQQGSAAQQQPVPAEGPSLLRRMLSGLVQQNLPQPMVGLSHPLDVVLAMPPRRSGPQPSLLCHSNLEQTAGAEPGRSAAPSGPEGVSRVPGLNRAPLLFEYDQATVQSPPADAAAQHTQPAAPSAGPSRVPYGGPEESMGDNGSSRHTFDGPSTAADASRAPANSEKENAQARRAQYAAATGGGQQLSPGKGPRQFGTELGICAAEHGLPSSTAHGDSDVVSSDLS